MSPLLYLSPKLAHDIAPWALKIYSLFQSEKYYNWKPFNWNGLSFNNPIGIAGGVDKNAYNINEWWKLGFGFLEVGTITPKPQLVNLGQILKRDKKSLSVWNKMGFPNDGADIIFNRISKFNKPFKTPLFINIGKNRNTQLSDAYKDYQHCINKFNETADVFVINISSPNTENLRKLQNTDELELLINTVKDNTEKPFLLKLSPDLNSTEFRKILDLSAKKKVNGWILTNTTTLRKNDNYPKEGGISGAPLKEQSEKMLSECIEHFGAQRKDYLIVSVGGVFNHQDVLKRIDLGANLVQIYSSLIFYGPKILKSLLNIEE